jgi:hypothetical protein
MKIILSLTFASLLAVPAMAQNLPVTYEMGTKIVASFENRHTIGIYGKVIDQDGNPIVGADVTGSVSRMQGWYEDFKWVSHTTQTDTNGLFQFVGLTGAGWNLSVKKDGYEIDYRKGYSGPKCSTDGSQTKPDNHVILTMYKRHGAEPMIHIKLHSYIRCEGTVTRFELLTGKKNPDGDFEVSLTRNPFNIDPRKPFDWILTLEITNGGFQVVTNIYPNEAPADGYQPQIVFHYEPGSSNWTSQIQPQLYFKGENGQVYGRMTLKVMTDYQPPPTLFNADIYANPKGSRNLEFDRSKQIMR